MSFAKVNLIQKMIDILAINKIQLWLFYNFFNLNGTLDLSETWSGPWSSYLFYGDLVILIVSIFLNNLLLESHILKGSLNNHSRCLHFLHLYQMVLLFLSESENIRHYEHNERYLSCTPYGTHHNYRTSDHWIWKEIPIPHRCYSNHHLVDCQEDWGVSSVIRAVQEGF